MNERDRIELLMKCYELSPSQFAERTGIQRASVSHILSGRNKPSLEVMLKIYDSFPGLDMKWLMTGVGEEPSVVSALSVNSDAQPKGLFGDIETAMEGDALQNSYVSEEREMVVRKPHMRQVVQAEKTQKRAQQRQAATERSIPQRRIKEVRIFYTDGTYETLVPEK